MHRHQINIEELKAEMIKGEKASFNQFYKFYYPRLKYYGLQFNLKLSSYSVEDTIQELFMWLYKNHKKLNEIDNLEVYVLSAFKQNIYKEINKTCKKRQGLESNLNSLSVQPAEDSVEHNYIKIEDANHLSDKANQILEQLPPNQKEVLYLRNYMDMSYKEIAEVMQLSEQVVRNYSYRAIQKLRAKHNSFIIDVSASFRQSFLNLC